MPVTAALRTANRGHVSLATCSLWQLALLLARFHFLSLRVGRPDPPLFLSLSLSLVRICRICLLRCPNEAVFVCLHEFVQIPICVLSVTVHGKVLPVIHPNNENSRIFCQSRL